MKVVVTGAAGFIGYHLVRRLLREKHDVYCLDNFNSYYTPALKRDRIAELKREFGDVKLFEIDIADAKVEEIFSDIAPNSVVHLAAQAGVRYSLQNPWAYVNSNLIGFQRVLESVKRVKPQHFIFASSSSVYGANTKTPYATTDRVDDPVSMYAVTKRSNELMGKLYSETFSLPTTALRFFTVYGSWGRPDMAYFSFTKKILNGQPIEIFNNGKLRRDFTHVSDIVESLTRLLDLEPKSEKPFRLLNIGASQPVNLLDFVSTLEHILNKKAKLEMKPHQPGDVYETFADVSELESLTHFRPVVNLSKGLEEFYQWFQTADAINKY